MFVSTYKDAFFLRNCYIYSTFLSVGNFSYTDNKGNIRHGYPLIYMENIN